MAIPHVALLVHVHVTLLTYYYLLDGVKKEYVSYTIMYIWPYLHVVTQA